MSALTPISIDSFKCRRTLTVDGKAYEYYSLPEAEKNGLAGVSQLPFSMRRCTSSAVKGPCSRVRMRNIALRGSVTR